jgi:predicted metal-dependent enzyme (double-stranded beta helix superfamily)
MTPNLTHYCHSWSQAVAAINTQDERMAFFQHHFPELLLDRNTLVQVLEQMAHGGAWPDLRQARLFANEVLLYLDPGRRFSLRAYFHPPAWHTEIHDHTAWGVSGTPFGRLSVITYQRRDEGKTERCELEPGQQSLLNPGEVALTLPWDQGIHQTGSPDDRINVMFSVYGRPGRRLHINIYDIQNGRVRRRFAPRIHRRMLAQAALDAARTT